MARDAFAEALFANARERIVHELKQGPVIVSLAEKKLFGVGVSGLVGEIYGGIFVGFTAFLLRASNAADQLIAACEKFLFIVFEALLIHRPIQRGGQIPRPKRSIVETTLTVVKPVPYFQLGVCSKNKSLAVTR